MKNLNNAVQLIGHLGKTPDFTLLESGKKLARVSLATSESYFDNKGEKINAITWHKLVAWDHKADYLNNHLDKGNKVMVQGRISTRSYEDKQGVVRYITEVIITDILKLSKEE